MPEALPPIGYFPKQTAVPDTWTYAPTVTSICSVSTCIGSAPEGWLQRWIHNDWGVFASPSDARSVIPEGAHGFTLFAYRLLPRRSRAMASPGKCASMHPACSTRSRKPPCSPNGAPKGELNPAPTTSPKSSANPHLLQRRRLPSHNLHIAPRAPHGLFGCCVRTGYRAGKRMLDLPMPTCLLSDKQPYEPCVEHLEPPGSQYAGSIMSAWHAPALAKRFRSTFGLPICGV